MGIKGRKIKDSAVVVLFLKFIFCDFIYGVGSFLLGFRIYRCERLIAISIFFLFLFFSFLLQCIAIVIKSF